MDKKISVNKLELSCAKLSLSHNQIILTSLVVYFISNTSKIR